MQQLADRIDSTASNFRGEEKQTVSVDTIKNLEYGKLALSESMATRIAQATGISMQWLQQNDSRAPMKAYTGREWVAADWLNSEGKTSAISPDDVAFTKSEVRFKMAYVTRLLGSILMACSKDPLKMQRALFRLAGFLKETRRDFGKDQETFNEGASAFCKEEKLFAVARAKRFQSMTKPLEVVAQANGHIVEKTSSSFSVRLTPAQDKKLRSALTKKIRSESRLKRP